MAQQLIGRHSTLHVEGEADARPTATITYPDGSSTDISAFAVHREAVPDTSTSAGYPARWAIRTPEFTTEGRHTITVDGVDYIIDVFEPDPVTGSTPPVELNQED